MTRIPTRRSLFPFVCWSSWVLGLATGIAVLGLYALVGDASSEAVPALQLEDAELERQHDLQLLAEVGQIALEAHAQGMREAIAASQGTPDREVLQRSCAHLWGMEHEQ